MQRLRLIILLAAIVLILSGCAEANEVENQAYAIILGIDKSNAGEFEISAQIPKAGSGSSSGESGSGNSERSSPYFVVSAKGDTVAEAFESLQWEVPRELNLSHIKLIITSERLAKSDGFSEIVSVIAETFQLYTSARFVVCAGPAKEFIEEHETIIGTRLSTEIDAMFEHYIARGFIPDTTFADLYYGMNTFYSDPIVIWGFSTDEKVKEPSETSVASIILPNDDGSNQISSSSKRHFLGAALFADGIMKERIKKEDMILINLLRGSINTFSYQHDNAIIQLTPVKRPTIKVSIIEGIPRISIKICLSAIIQGAYEGNAELEERIENDIYKMIFKFQNKKIEPFGFAEKAAWNFYTIQEWLDYNWREKFSSAEIALEVRVSDATV